MMPQKALSKQEKDWRAEDDARTLTRYAEVVADNERLTMAQAFLEKQVNNIASMLEQTTKARGII